MNKWINVWNWPLRKTYYLTHPWKWIHELFINIKAAHMRMHKGYCYTDIWNFDDWFTHVAPSMLRHLADYGSCYPAVEPFETSEKWHNWLYMMAERLEECGRDTLDVLEEKNEYSQQMHEALQAAQKRWKENHPDEKHTHGQDFTPEEEELRKKYWEREKEIVKDREQFIQETFTELGKHWDCLWD